MSEIPASLSDLIDFARYPVHDPDGSGAALAASCRSELLATGSCLLDGFLTPQAIERVARESATLVPLAHRERGGRRGTAYLAPPDESFPESHPRRRLQTTSVGAVAYDLIPPEHGLRQIYEWDGLLDFLARTIGAARLFRYADPLGALNVAVMQEGEHLLWHFDQTDFVVSIMLQSSEAGGDFEYVPHIRTPDAPNYERIERLLDGDRSEVVRLAMPPGTMALFMGRYSIHRVTPIEGDRPRLIGLLGYDTQPGVMSSEHLKRRRYGRTDALV